MQNKFTPTSKPLIKWSLSVLIAVVQLGVSQSGQGAYAQEDSERSSSETESGDKLLKLNLDKSECQCESDLAKRKYWVGLDCRPTCPVLRSQLGINGGVAILIVGEDSPASQAGIRPLDILVSINGSPINSGEQLSDVVDDCQDKKVSVKLMREGRFIRVHLTPAVRPVCRRITEVVVADRFGNFDVAAAKKSIQEQIDKVSDDNSYFVVELFLVNPAIVGPTPGVVRVIDKKSSDGNYVVDSTVNRFWNNDEAKGLELIRLEADMAELLATVVDFQDELNVENATIQRLFDSLYREQTRLKRKISNQLTQLKRLNKDEQVFELRQETENVRADCLELNQLLDQLVRYRNALNRFVSN